MTSIKSSTLKWVTLEDLCNVFIARKRRNTENRSQIESREKNPSEKPKFFVQIPILETTLKVVVIKNHLSNLLASSLPIIPQRIKIRHPNFSSKCRKKPTKNVIRYKKKASAPRQSIKLRL